MAWLLALCLTMAPRGADASPADPRAPAATVPTAVASEPQQRPRTSAPASAKTTPDDRGEAAPVPADPTPTGPSGSIGDASATFDDAAAQEATRQLEGDTLEARRDVPQRMSALQAGAWWSMFGTLALGTAAAIFAGAAERQQDQITRLSVLYGDDGSMATYEDIRDQYTQMLDRGNAYAWTARGFLIASGVTLVVGLTLFGLNRKRAGKASARLRGGLGVRF